MSKDRGQRDLARPIELVSEPFAGCEFPRRGNRGARRGRPLDTSDRARTHVEAPRSTLSRRWPASTSFQSAKGAPSDCPTGCRVTRPGKDCRRQESDRRQGARGIRASTEADQPHRAPLRRKRCRSGRWKYGGHRPAQARSSGTQPRCLASSRGGRRFACEVGAAHRCARGPFIGGERVIGTPPDPQLIASIQGSDRRSGGAGISSV
jgi:hypothetical protein